VRVLAEETAHSAENAKALKLLVIIAIKDMKLKEQVDFMSRAGFDRNDMARLLGTTPNSISVRMAELKNEAKKKRRSTTRT
jgi:hypothetical protein